MRQDTARLLVTLRAQLVDVISERLSRAFDVVMTWIAPPENCANQMLVASATPMSKKALTSSSGSM
jgi:hypothetical protein